MIKVLFKSAWGSDDPTKATFAFLHANAFGRLTNLCGRSG